MGILRRFMDALLMSTVIIPLFMVILFLYMHVWLFFSWWNFDFYNETKKSFIKAIKWFIQEQGE